MATNYPGALDNGTSLPYPTTGSFTNSPSLAGGQDNQNDAIIAVETKLGTGASTPANATFLTGTGAGISAWANTVPAGTVVGTSDIQTLTNKTLTSPTINNPTISNATISADTVTGFTVSNNGTIYGISVTGGTIGSAGLASGAVTATKIGTDSSFAWTDYSATSTIVGWSSFTTKIVRYSQIGKTVTVVFILAGTSNSTTATFTVGIAAKNIGADFSNSTGLNTDNSAVQINPGRIYLDPTANTTLVNITKAGGTTSWTASGTKDIRGMLIYEAA